MNSVLIKRVPRVEGIMRVMLSQTAEQKSVYLKSGRSTHIRQLLTDRYPLESIQCAQSLSTHSCVAHAVASVAALEDYLHIYPTETSLRIRQVLLDLAAIRSHIQHFYWELLPDYLNIEHFQPFREKELWFYADVSFKDRNEGDLPLEAGRLMIPNVAEAARVLDLLQKTITLYSGKFPVIMNMVPGGISNFSISRDLNMKVIRNLDFCKRFIEEIWPLDIKSFIQNCPESVTVYSKDLNLLSFGSIRIEQNQGKTSNYSVGVYLNGKLEPVNELKITETLDNTFFLPVENNNEESRVTYNFKKPDARTWIRGARYDGETMLTGALSRMMVTYLVGGNLEISDKVGQMIDNLDLTFESPNCIASRVLAEVLESRLYLKNIFRNLFDLDHDGDLNRKIYFNFAAENVGVGKVEAPDGSLMHQVFIEDDKITAYRIISGMNWNFSPMDNELSSGIVEEELNSLIRKENYDPIQLSRILHSYNVHVLDGTQ